MGDIVLTYLQDSYLEVSLYSVISSTSLLPKPSPASLFLLITTSLSTLYGPLHTRRPSSYSIPLSTPNPLIPTPQILPDSLVGVAFVRNIMATALVFALAPWLDGMGIYNAFVLFGCLAVAFSLSAVPMLIWGKRWRARRAERYRWYAGRQFGGVGRL